MQEGGGADQGPGLWTGPGRLAVFLLGASSIAALLSEFYGLWPMRAFTLAAFLPALTVLGALACWDRVRGGGGLWTGVATGAVAGLCAALAYDIFRLPFVFSRAWGLSAVVPPMPLFKVFPRFGALILAEPLEQASYTLPAQLVGWAYHFSNGATFGVMYLAMVGRGLRRHWLWAVVMAAGLEAGMLVTPYPQTFGIKVTGRFVAVTLAAHMIFGVALGLLARKFDQMGWFQLGRGRAQAVPADGRPTSNPSR